MLRILWVFLIVISLPVQAGDHPYVEMQALIKDLSITDKQHFFQLYSAYNTMGTVSMVRSDVRRAIGACGAHNPEMKEKLNARFKAWDKDLAPVLDEVNGHVNNMIIAQDYAEEEIIRSIMQKMDNVRRDTASSIEKIPVTTPEACQYLHDKMDETQAQMTTLLRQMLISTPFSRGTH
jgi:hypothetical protein